jgi:hypothetical protein
MLTEDGYNALEMKIDQVHSQLASAIGALNARFDRVIEWAGFTPQDEQREPWLNVAEVDELAVSAANTGDFERLALIFDEAAKHALEHDADALLNTAAARYLAISEPEAARQIIPELIEKATGPTAKRILEIALRTANS